MSTVMASTVHAPDFAAAKVRQQVAWSTGNYALTTQSKAVFGQLDWEVSEQIKLTASFGVSELSADLADIDALVRRADAAMYQAKHEGRNRVVVAASDGSTERSVVGG